MATYVTTFAEYTADVAPSDWTERWVTTNSDWIVRANSGADGGKWLEPTSTVDARRLLSWDDIDADADRDDVEVLARVRTSNAAADQFRLHVRSSGAAGAENSYHFIFNTTTGLQIFKYVAATSTSIGGPVSISWSVNTWYYMRFRANGTALKAKWWADGTEEPSAWTIEVTDSSISAAGWVGVGNFESDGTRLIDYVSIGTNGDTAPLNAGVDTTERTTQLAVETISSINPTSRVTQLAVEMISSNALKMHVTQIAVEMVSTNVADDIVGGPSMLFIAT